MKRLAALLMILVGSCFAQYIPVTASSCITDGSGQPIANGIFQVKATDQFNNPIPFRIGTAVQAITDPIKWTITNGSLPNGIQLADPTQTSPRNIHYLVSIKDSNTNQTASYVNVDITANDGSNFNWCKYNTGQSNPNLPVTIVSGPAGLQGPAGSNGAAATVAVGTTTTGTPGSNASVSNSGSSSTAILDFTIPAGETGSTGATGPAGSTGATGATGAAGPNQVTTSTTTNINGLIKGDGAHIGQAVAGTDYQALLPGVSTDSANGINVAGKVAAASVCNSGGLIDVKACYGAKGDERFVTDASITGGASTLTSATAAFTSADTGKTVTVNAGTAGVGSGTYTSGGSITGSTGQACLLTTFNNGGTATTASIKLTGTNTIVGGSPLVMTAQGVPTSAPTSATLSSGTATCSGTATVSTTLYYQPITSTMTYVNATTATLATTATNSVTNANASIGTDDSTAIANALTALYNAKGGTAYFSRGTYLVISQIAIPNDGSTPAKQPPITLTGEGGVWDGTFGTGVPSASTIDLRASSVGKINTLGRGTLTVQRLNLADNGYDSIPFINTTLTTLQIQDNSFTGSGIGNALSQNDAVQMGASAQFQGYGTVIQRNNFQKILRGVYGMNSVNGTQTVLNIFSATSGGNEAAKFDGTTGGAAQNVFANNLFESVYYKYVITYNNSGSNILGFNTYWDQGILYSGLMNITGTSPNNVCYGCNSAVNFTVNDPSANGYVMYGQGVNGINFLNIGTTSNGVSGRLWISNTANDIRMTYPTVTDFDLKVDSSGNVNSTGAKTAAFYTYDRATKSPGLISTGTTFTIASGCGTPGSLTGGATVGSFTAGQTACAPVLTFGVTAPHGWVCTTWDLTTTADTLKQIASSTTTATLSGTVATNDVITFGCQGF